MIRKQRGTVSKPPLAKVSQNGEFIFDVDEQVKDWWTYFDDLSNPSDNAPGKEVRFLLLLCELSRSDPIPPFTLNEVQFAIMELRPKKKIIMSPVSRPDPAQKGRPKIFFYIILF